ncbi:MAG: recombination mediator RecR [bacterium]|nr:recombination mediator RecR [bacterium]
MYPKQIQKLIKLFSGFPTVGQRTASRFVFHLLKTPKKEVKELLEAIAELKNEVSLCAKCFTPFDAGSSKGELCAICEDPMRDQKLLCVVEKESDLEALENTKEYKGLYFILGGAVDPLQKEQRDTLRVKELEGRLRQSPFSEVIIATNPTSEGEATAFYLERTLKPLNLKITRLGRGLPIGGEIEYADGETIRQALEGRK